MLMLNPVMANLHNLKTGRWHPIVFAESTLPGGSDGVVRHKSSRHHTVGFESKADAEEHARKDLAPRIEGARLKLDAVLEWDGEGVPAMVKFFG